MISYVHLNLFLNRFKRISNDKYTTRKFDIQIPFFLRSLSVNISYNNQYINQLILVRWRIEIDFESHSISRRWRRSIERRTTRFRGRPRKERARFNAFSWSLLHISLHISKINLIFRSTFNPFRIRLNKLSYRANRLLIDANKVIYIMRSRRKNIYFSTDVYFEANNVENNWSFNSRNIVR